MNWQEINSLLSESTFKTIIPIESGYRIILKDYKNQEHRIDLISSLEMSENKITSSIQILKCK